jgi:hypothetical protein
MINKIRLNLILARSCHEKSLVKHGDGSVVSITMTTTKHYFNLILKLIFIIIIIIIFITIIAPVLTHTHTHSRFAKTSVCAYIYLLQKLQQIRLQVNAITCLTKQMGERIEYMQKKCCNC